MIRSFAFGTLSSLPNFLFLFRSQNWKAAVPMPGMRAPHLLSKECHAAYPPLPGEERVGVRGAMHLAMLS